MRRLLLTATALCPLLAAPASAGNDFLSGFAGGAVGGIVGGILNNMQQQQQQQEQQRQIQQQQQFLQQQQLRQQQIDAEHNAAAARAQQDAAQRQQRQAAQPAPHVAVHAWAGPGFACYEPESDPVLRTICGSQDLSESALELRQAVNAASQQTPYNATQLQAEYTAFLKNLRTSCAPSHQVDCISGSLMAQRQQVTVRLTGAYADEANRPVALQIMIQQRLHDIGLFAGPIDGVYSDTTRRAISRWQTTQGRPATGVMSSDDVAILIPQSRPQVAVSASVAQTTQTVVAQPSVQATAPAPAQVAATVPPPAASPPQIQAVAPASTPTPSQTTIANTDVTVTNVTVVQQLTLEASSLRGLINLFRGILDEQKKTSAGDCSGDQTIVDDATAVVERRIKELEAQFSMTTTKLSQYSTSIRPNDPDMHITARKASELYPKVPYYIPGTPDEGEFWLEPNVNDHGQLEFLLKFVDPKSADRIRSTITMKPAEIDLTRNALCKVVKWSQVAHKDGIRRQISKRAICFPEDACPAENQRRDGVTSTEVIFNVYEDGATAGRIQRNKGLFVEGYNVSVDSALLLEAYLTHVINAGKSEFDTGAATDEELKARFK